MNSKYFLWGITTLVIFLLVRTRLPRQKDRNVIALFMALAVFMLGSAGINFISKTDSYEDEIVCDSKLVYDNQNNCYLYRISEGLNSSKFYYKTNEGDKTTKHETINFVKSSENKVLTTRQVPKNKTLKKLSIFYKDETTTFYVDSYKTILKEKESEEHGKINF